MHSKCRLSTKSENACTCTIQESGSAVHSRHPEGMKDKTPKQIIPRKRRPPTHIYLNRVRDVNRHMVVSIRVNMVSEPRPHTQENDRRDQGSAVSDLHRLGAQGLYVRDSGLFYSSYRPQYQLESSGAARLLGVGVGEIWHPRREGGGVHILFPMTRQPPPLCLGPRIMNT